MHRINRAPRNLVLPAVACLVLSLVGTATGARLKVPQGRGPASTTQVTYASWYGWGFAWRPTASGELFDPRALTAAHRTLPLGTRVRVTHLGNGRSVVLRITDRGPYHKGRGIDLSREAARQLRMLHQGVAKVKVEVLPSTNPIQPTATALAALPSAIHGARALSL